jgi:hypothetical protein
VGSHATAGSAQGVDVEGKRAYVAADQGGLVLFDLTTLDHQLFLPWSAR